MLKSSVFNYFCNYNNDEIIVFNKLHGSISVLEKDVADKVSNNMLLTIDDITQKNLNDAGFITTMEDEFLYAKDLYTTSMRNSTDLHITVEMTQSCNLKCHYCYQNDYRESGSIKSETFDALYQYINKVVSSKVRPISKIYFNIIGGEPLLLKDKVISFSRKIRKFVEDNSMELSIGINTNGVFLDESIITEIDRLSIAITNLEDHDKLRIYKKDGAGSFQDIMNVLEKHVDSINKLEEFSIRYNVNETNRFGYDNLFKKLDALGFINYDIDLYNTINYTFNSEANRVDNGSYKKYYMDYLRYLFINDRKIKVFPTPTFSPCKGYIPYNIKISHDGKLALCDAFYHPIGDVKNLNNDINGAMEHFNDYYALNPFEDEQCKDCQNIGICGGKLFCKSSSNTNDLSYCDFLPYHIDDYLKFFVSSFGEKPELFHISDRTI